MSCPDAGALRAARDDERPDLAPHAATCPACQGRLREQADDARLAAVALADPGMADPGMADPGMADPGMSDPGMSDPGIDGPAPVVDVDVALARLRSLQAAPVVPLRPMTVRTTALGRVAAALIAVVVMGGVLATPNGRAAAASLLERFRTEQLVVVPIDVAAVDPAALEALVGVAEVEGLEALVEPQEVADLAAAAAVSGIAAAPLDPATFPAGVTGPVTVLAQAPQTVRVGFADAPDVPAALRAATLVLDVPGAVVQVVGDDGDRPGGVLWGEAGQLEVSVEGGPTLAEVREALLALPGLPPETVDTLRRIEDWQTTLPLPVPVGSVVWEPTTVDGRPALAFGDETGLGSALLWQQDGRFVGVGGMLPLSEVRRMAES